MQDESICLPDTRVDVLQEIYDWVDGQDERCIFWLSGLAGTGKSTIARTVARKYNNQERLGASFFFSRGREDVSHADKFVTSIAVQLAHNVPTLMRFVCDANAERSDITSESLPDQWRQLVLGPLLKLDGNSFPSSYLLVIDALDECDNEKHIGSILQLLAEARLLTMVRLRIFMTSRPETPIRHGFDGILGVQHRDLVLHDIASEIIDHDISIFLEHNLERIRQEHALRSGWPGEKAIRRLVRNASGLFIWAATACRFIREGRKFAESRLSILLQSDRSISEPEKQLNEIYTTVLKHSISPTYTDEEKEESYRMLRHIVGSIMVLFSPLSADSLSRLLGVTKQKVDQTLDDLRAIIDIPNSPTRPLSLHHPSFRDFLLNEDRCSDSNFRVDKQDMHGILADSCLELMSRPGSLGENISHLESPGTLRKEIGQNITACLPADMQYACRYWVHHLEQAGRRVHDRDPVHKFLQTHFLHWLEALSLAESISESPSLIGTLQSLIAVSK
jgi:hypothetical protein